MLMTRRDFLQSSLAAAGAAGLPLPKAPLAIKKGLVDQHKEWTIRSYVVTFGFVTFRVTQIALQGAGFGLQPAIEIAAWSCWALPLLIAEVAIQARKIAQVSS